MSRLKAQIEAECRKTMSSVKGDKVDSFTKRRMAMMTDETTKDSDSYEKMSLPSTYTVYKVNLDGKLSNKEHLNNIDELNEWLEQKSHKFANVLIIQDATGKRKYMTHVNGRWVEMKNIAEQKMSSDESTEATGLYKEVTEGESKDNIHLAHYKVTLKKTLGQLPAGTVIWEGEAQNQKEVMKHVARANYQASIFPNILNIQKGEPSDHKAWQHANDIDSWNKAWEKNKV